MEADGSADTNTRERTEGAATAVQVMHGDNVFASRVNPGSKTNSASFGVKIEPPALACRDDVVVENGAAALKSCLLPWEMRTTSAASGLLPTGKTSTATKTTFNQPRLRLYSFEETNLWTPILSVSYDSIFWKNNLPAVPSCLRVIGTKSGQNEIFDLGDSQGRLRACPFLGTWRALRCGEVMCVGEAGDNLQRFLDDR